MNEDPTKSKAGKSRSKRPVELNKDHPPQILVVDDSPDIMLLLTEIITNDGYQVRPAFNGLTALKSVDVEAPDLILLDIKLPDIDGYEVCRRLKSGEQSSRVPVIFISGLADTIEKVMGFDAGGVDYITKPFHPAEILARIKTHLAPGQLQTQLEEQNIQLQQEIAERKRAEEDLKQHQALLEGIVAERTADIRSINEELQREIADRRHVEEALEQANYKLHAMVYEYGLRHQKLYLFKQMSEQIQGCTVFEETYPVINQFGKKLFPGTVGSLFILDSQTNMLHAVAAWGKTATREKPFIPEDCHALERKQMHVTIGSHQELRCRHLSGVHSGGSLCIPLLSQGKALGMLHLQQRHPPGSIAAGEEYDDTLEGMDTEVQQLAVTVADHLALALANIKLRDTLKQQAIRDPLTGLFNRRFMEETLKREIDRALRYGTTLGIIMIDLDHFRRFNDTFGHEAGDIVLQNMGRFLQNNIRKEDVACRYGGEEFTVILPGASLDITRKRAETLRDMAQHIQICYNGNILDSITLSLGIAIFPEHGSTVDEVIQAADVALYKAKNDGRNRIEAAGDASPSQTTRIH